MHVSATWLNWCRNGIPFSQPAQVQIFIRTTSVQVISFWQQHQRRSSFAVLLSPGAVMKIETETSIRAAEPQQNRIANQFRALTTILAILCPYRIKCSKIGHVFDRKDQDASSGPYTVPNFTWKSPLTLYPYFLLLWYILTLTIQAFNLARYLSFPFRLEL